MEIYLIFLITFRETKTYPTRQSRPATMWVLELAVCVILVVLLAPQAGQRTLLRFGPKCRVSATAKSDVRRALRQNYQIIY